MKNENWMLSLGLFLLRLAVLIFVVAAIFRVGETAYDYCYGIMSDTAVDLEPGRDVSITIEPDMSAKAVAKLLERKGLVEKASVFQVQLKVSQYDEKLKAGTYELNTSMRPRKMMKIMAGEEETGEGS